MINKENKMIEELKVNKDHKMLLDLLAISRGDK